MMSLMMEPFLPAHLITPVKDRANSRCVVELQPQQSLAEDVMCMQECVCGINIEQSSTLTVWLIWESPLLIGSLHKV